MTTDHRVRWKTLLGELVLLPPRPRLVNIPVLRAFEKANWRHKFNARKRCDRIEATAPERHKFLVATQPRSYLSYPVVEELLRRVKRLVFDDPMRAQELARTALLIADRLTPAQPHMRITSFCREAQARAHANLGNVCRVLCQWPEAKVHLAKALELLWYSTGSPEVIAEVQSLRGSFLGDRRRFGEAIETLREAASLYQELGDEHQTGIVFLQMAGIYWLQGEPDRALPLHLEGSILIDERKDPGVEAALWNNLTRIQLDLERFDEVEESLALAPALFYRLQKASSVHLFRAWTEGCIHAVFGRFLVALDCLQEAHDGFYRRKDSFDAAQVNLDRLRVLARQGKRRVVQDAAPAVYEDLQAQGLSTRAEEVLRLVALPNLPG